MKVLMRKLDEVGQTMVNGIPFVSRLKKLFHYNLSIKSRVQTLCTSLALFSVLLTGGFNWWYAKQSAVENTRLNLITLADSRSDQIKHYFQQAEKNVYSLSQLHMVSEALLCFTDAAKSLPKESGVIWDEAHDQKLTQILEAQLKNKGVVGSSFQWLAQDDVGKQIQWLALQPKLSNQSTYARWLSHFNSGFNAYLSGLGYENIFLMDVEGRIVYSVKPQVSIGQNLLDERIGEDAQGLKLRLAVREVYDQYKPFMAKSNNNDHQSEVLSDDGFGDEGFEIAEVPETDGFEEDGFGEDPVNVEAAEPVAGQMSPSQPMPEATNHFADFHIYEPTGTNPNAFLFKPIIQGESFVGVVACQLQIADINRIVMSEIGLGETGQVKLVGSDHYLRSNTRFIPEGMLKEEILTDNVDLALNGERGLLATTSSEGRDVISAYEPVNAFGQTWALVVEKDEDEAYAILQTITTNMAILFCVIVVIVLVLTSYFTRGITKPILQLRERLKDFADGEGDLRKRLDEVGPYEVASSAFFFNKFIKDMHASMREVLNYSEDLTDASDELNDAASQLAKDSQDISNRSGVVNDAADNMNGNMSELSVTSEKIIEEMKSSASSVEQISDGIAEVSKNVTSAAEASVEASQLADNSNEQVHALKEAADQIGQVIDVIEEIAEQTNLLALNATIEAARAGDAGKGFSVVASEVKKLAKQTADATDDIRHRVNAIQQTSHSWVGVIGEVVSSINEVKLVSEAIAESVQMQTKEATSVAQNMAKTSSMAQSAGDKVANSAEACREITQNISNVNQSAQQTSGAAMCTRNSGEELARYAQRLQEMVGKYKL